MEYQSVSDGEPRLMGLQIVDPSEPEKEVGNQDLVYWAAAPFAIAAVSVVALLAGLIVWRRRSAEKRRKAKYVAMADLDLESVRE